MFQETLRDDLKVVGHGTKSRVSSLVSDISNLNSFFFQIVNFQVSTIARSFQKSRKTFLPPIANVIVPGSFES